MKASALTISLILILVPLAGCAGSDGEVNIDLTTEEIQELIDDNIDDFLNNTTVTVNQQNQNNNTTNQTTVNNYYNNTTIQQPSSLKAKSGTMIGVETMNDYAVGAVILVRSDKFSIDTNLNNANICVGVGTALEGELQQWFNSNEISFTTIGTPDATESVEKMKAGTCDAVPFDSMQLAVSVRGQLEQDSDWMASDYQTDLWIAPLVQGELGTLSEVGSSASILVEQSSDEVIIGLRYLFLQTELSGTCIENANDCENFTIAISPTYLSSVSTCSHGTPFHYEIYNFMDADKGVYSYWGDGPWNAMFGGQGLNCTHSLNFEINLAVDDLNSNFWNSSFDRDYHTLSWGEWSYSMVWETMSIEQEN